MALYRQLTFSVLLVSPTAFCTQGSDTYHKACAACHQGGFGGAPSIRDIASWEVRRKKGVAALIHNAISGVGAMPAKGGNPNISDEDIAAAVNYMLFLATQGEEVK